MLAGADEFRITDVGHEPSLRAARDVSVNPLDPLCGACTGPLDTDAKHRITLSAVYQGPWGINAAGMFRYRSGTPYTLVSGRDLNGDGFRLDLAPGVTEVNSARGASFSQLDLRLSKDFIVGPVSLELIGEVFNVFNKTNPNAYTLDFFNNPANPKDPRNGDLIGSHPTAFAGDPLQGEQRLAQLGLRVKF